MSNKENKHILRNVIGLTALGAASAYGGFSFIAFKNIFDLSKKSKSLHVFEEEKTEWLKHSGSRDEIIDSYDGLKLHAISIANHPENHRWLILVPGYNNAGDSLLEYMYEADHRDLNLLVIDPRGTGVSSGKYTGLGWNEHYDLLSWINYVLTLDSQAKIALFGLNTGANAVMNVLGDYLPANVVCAIEDGGFSNMHEYVAHHIQKTYKLDGKPFTPAIDLCVRQFLRFSMSDADTKRQLNQSHTPTLFIHGVDDDVVPLSNLFDLYYACASEKELYTCDQLGYETTYRAKDYFSVFFHFIESYM